ncbi:MAG TPA: UPF0182 family protein [Candidatus Dormibacteraeota bacterium]
MRRNPFEPPGRPPFDFESYDFRIPPIPRRVWIGLALIAAAIVIVIIASPLVGFYTDLAWYRALGLDAVFLTRLRLQWLLFVGSLVVSFAYLYANARLAIGSSAPRALRAVGVGGPGARAQRIAAAITAGLLALFFSLGAGSSWQTLALFTGASDSGVTDPVFHLDISFYLLRLPFYEAVLAWALALAFVALVVAGVFHAWRLGGFEPLLGGRALAHLSVLLGIAALLLGIRRWFDRYDLLSSHNGFVWGAGFADINARIPLATVGAVVAILLFLLLAVNARARRPGLVAGAVGAWVVMSIISGAYPGLVQRLQVQPAEQQVETPFIQREIAGTRAAYGLTSVGTQQFSGTSPLTPDEVAADQSTIQNLRLWDDRQLAATYDNLQTIRTYYNFPSINLDRYSINGVYQQVEIGPREVSFSQLPSSAQNWVNQRLKYTHGYGVAASQVSAVQGEGLPAYVVGDVPPTGPLQISQPAIYFGQNTTDYVIAPSLSPEFDYPRGAADVYNHYQGTRGVSLSGALDRALWSMRLGDLNVLISDQVTSQSQVLFRRDINTRLNEIAPFLTFDSHPYIVDADGQLYWIADAYTSSDAYPYSQTEDTGFGNLSAGINYVRNSVKAVVNAYDGSVQFYVSAPNDPIIKAYERTFPSLFKPLSDMPGALRAHIRVPQDMFTMQADIYSTYHVTDPAVFFQREDVWAFAQETPAPDAPPITLTPYYVLMRLPGESTPEYLQILPFTPNGKANMISWLAVRNDAPNYGQMVSFILPKDQVIFGPQQVSQRINEQATIARDFTLFNQAGSHVVQGNLLVVPVGNTFLYVEPVYLQATSGSSLVELRKVILVDSQTVAYQDDLSTALAQLLGQAPPPAATTTTAPPPPNVTSTKLQQLAADFIKHYNNAQADLRNGDLAGYASEMQAASSDAAQIAGQSSPSPAPKPSASP